MGLRSLTQRSPLTRRIIAIVLILFAMTGAWGVLGSTILYRTYEANGSIKSRVAAIWGDTHRQKPPTASYQETVTHREETETNGRRQVKVHQENVTVPLDLQQSRITVDLDLDHRQKGLLWYSTYNVAFDGRYGFRNDTDQPRKVTFSLPFPSSQAIYDDLILQVDGRNLPFHNDRETAYGTAVIPAHATANLRVAYRSRGMERWVYAFGVSEDVSQVHDFRLDMTTDFRDVDFADNSLSPSFKVQIPGGWKLTWQYKNLLTGFQIGMILPEKLQPGPLAGMISYFAPVSLMFFFFWLFILTTIRGIPLHPMNYFFLAAAFFAFHLLLAYMVDHLSIHVAFLICSLVSIFLVVSYLRLVVGPRFALIEAGVAQFVYLVLFSYAFFFQGFTGLAIAIGAVVSLFVVMQLTGRIDWDKQFAAGAETAPPPAEPEPPPATGMALH
jgi:hypothetical protein